jgi:hypothetical protein
MYVEEQRVGPATTGDGATIDLFGSSVAISGDVAIVGVPYDDVGYNGDQGSVYVFLRSGNTWLQQAKLTAGDGAADDRFGSSVALSGGTAIVGARRGSAYVFVRSGNTWVQQAKLTAGDVSNPSPRTGGSSSIVAISGDTAVVSFSPGEPVYVFVRNRTTWSEQAQVTAGDQAFGRSFGCTLAIDGDTAIVGAPYRSAGADSHQASAYVFVRTGASWAQQARLFRTWRGLGSSFASSVALFGDTAIVGAWWDDGGAGAAYVFVRNGTTWSEQARLSASDGGSGDLFGSSVALFGDTTIVGATFDPTGGQAHQGSAYVFMRTGVSWAQQSKLTRTTVGGSFGSSVAFSGDRVVVGAPRDDIRANQDQGSVYVFVRSGTTWARESKLTAGDGAANDGFGRSVALFNDTAIVGAPDDGVGANTRQGSAYVFVRDGTTWLQQAQLIASDGEAFANFGFSVAVAGDTAIVGAHHYIVGANDNQGAAYVFVRSTAAWSQQAKFVVSDASSEDGFGYAVALAGDTAVVGAPKSSVGANAHQGSAYVFVRNGTTWSEQARLSTSDGGVWDHFGSSVALSGDTAVIAAPGDDVHGNPDQGSAYVFVRSGTTWSKQAQLTAGDGAANDRLGSVALFGDTAIIGVPDDDVGTNRDQGAAYVFIRNGTTWLQQARQIEQDAPTAGVMRSVMGCTGGSCNKCRRSSLRHSTVFSLLGSL